MIGQKGDTRAREDTAMRRRKGVEVTRRENGRGEDDKAYKGEGRVPDIRKGTEPRLMGQIQKIQAQIDDTVGIMHENM